VDDESKLTLHGLVQHYTMLSEEGKNKRLMDLLDQLDFNQVRHCTGINFSGNKVGSVSQHLRCCAAMSLHIK